MRGVTGWLMAALLATGAANARAAVPDDPAALEAFVDGVVVPLMKNYSSPSGTIAIARGGRTVFAKGYGFQDVRTQTPVDPDRTLFRPGSVSKLFTWVAVMQLVEQGKLDLDADVNNYLTSFRIREAFDAPVTLRHILTHTAGFEDGGLGYLIGEDIDRALPLAEAMERYQPRRVNPPGAQTAYSNYATALAGLIVANVSGLSFEEYIRRNIFEPLGMRNSTFEEPLPQRLAGQMAAGYSAEAGTFVEKPFEIISSFGPAGALSSTATDMVRFAQAILNGGELDGQRILKEETVDLMLSRHFSHDPRLAGMGLGFYETDYNGQQVWGHGGDTRWFHSYLGIDRDNDLAFFVSFSGSGGSTVRFSIANALYDEYFPRTEAPPVPPADFAARAARYAGTYAFWRSNFSTIEKAVGLVSTVKVVPTADNTLLVAFRSGKPKQYAEVEPNLFREMSPYMPFLDGFSPRLIAFQENEAGEITGFVIDGLPFMSLRRLAMHETPAFNFTLLGLSFLVFAGTLLHRFYQRRDIAALPGRDRGAVNAASYAAGANFVVVIAAAIVLSVVGERLFIEIPLLFKLWLVLPILATLVNLYLAYCTVGVWKDRLLAGTWARARFTAVTLSALFVSWFYWYWNILGFRYH